MPHFNLRIHAMYLIGHRGTGKSTLLTRLSEYFSYENIEFIDLDHEIERTQHSSISEIFTLWGEAKFREFEKQQFDLILERFKNSNLIMALGAGFDINSIPANSCVVWLRRESDKLGRVFLDRPRLDTSLPAIEEYFYRYEMRNESFKKLNPIEYTMPEGLQSLQSKDHCFFRLERDFFYDILFDKSSESTLSKSPQVVYLTVFSFHLRTKESWSNFLCRYQDANLFGFEIRDDLISQVQLHSILPDLKKRKWIYSFRLSSDIAKKALDSSLFLDSIQTASSIDWPLEFQNFDFIKFFAPPKQVIISNHSNNVDIEKNAESEFSINSLYDCKYPVYLKWSPIVQSTSELYYLWKWQQSEPKNRSILPRSSDGRFRWFRIWMKGKQELNFISDSFLGLLDQPNSFQWQSSHAEAVEFAAVIGNPIQHSYSPTEHYEFFTDHRMNFYAIDLDPKTEKFSEAVHILNKIGLRAAAVTSPFKLAAAEISNIKTNIVKDLQSANTLYFASDSEIHSTNTDVFGLQSFLNEVDSATNLAVWGGGGVVKSILNIFPKAVIFSSRSGKIKEMTEPSHHLSGVSEEHFAPECLIWAAPPQHSNEMSYPPTKWRPKTVIDLNYTENSKAREYSISIGAKYVSGIEMFKIQAKEQQVFWEYMLDGRK